jgi:uncharacterized protein YfbU (UPF0304 family)
MELTKKERVILRNQYQILKHLDPASAERCDEIIAILENGYSIFYPEIGTGVEESELSEDQCQFVLDVLNAYQAIENYKDAHPRDKAVCEHLWGRFRGFDGNNESEYLRFARFLLQKQQKFAESARHAGSTDNFDSHTPTLSKYRNMVTVWKILGQESKLSKGGILQILDAGSNSGTSSLSSDSAKLGGVASILGNAAEKAKEGVSSLFDLLAGGAPKTEAKAGQEAQEPVSDDKPNSASAEPVPKAEAKPGRETPAMKVGAKPERETPAPEVKAKPEPEAPAAEPLPGDKPSSVSETPKPKTSAAKPKTAKPASRRTRKEA